MTPHRHPSRGFFAAVCLSLSASAAFAAGIEDGEAGLAAMDRGDYRRAVRLFTKALSAPLSQTDQELARLKRGESYLALKDHKRALADLDAALALAPDDKEAADARARVQEAIASARHTDSDAQEKPASPQPSAPRMVSFRDLDGNTYTGMAIGKTPEGAGTMLRANGDVFHGTFHNGDYVSGIYQWAEGDQYSGAFENNDPSGHGLYRWPNGTLYQGDFAQGQPNGNGTFTYPDGSRYTGSVRDGAPDGEGAMTHPDGRATSGTWSMGRGPPIGSTGLAASDADPSDGPAVPTAAGSSTAAAPAGSSTPAATAAPVRPAVSATPTAAVVPARPAVSAAPTASPAPAASAEPDDPDD